MTVPRPSRNAFTIVELLVVIFIVGFLISILLPSLCRSREQGSRVKCASNLRQIGLAMQMYAKDNRGNFPRTVFDGSESPAMPTAFTGAKASNPFGPDGPAANDVSAALYLVLRAQDLTSEVFVCPSSSAERSIGDARATSNFASADVLSYSYTNPYAPKAVTGKEGGYGFNLSSDFAIAADVNPGTLPSTGFQQDNVNPADGPNAKRSEMQRANTNNHNGDGQNVLYADGHVEFQSTPFCGMIRTVGSETMRDNIYVAGGHGTPATAAVFAAPVDALDSVCLPTDDAATTGPSPLVDAMNTREFGARRIVWLASGAVLLGSCGAGGLALRTSGKRRARRAVSDGVPAMV